MTRDVFDVHGGKVSKGLADDFNAVVKLLGGDDEGRSKTDDVIVSGLAEEAAVSEEEAKMPG